MQDNRVCPQCGKLGLCLEHLDVVQSLYLSDCSSQQEEMPANRQIVENDQQSQENETRASEEEERREQELSNQKKKNIVGLDEKESQENFLNLSIEQLQNYPYQKLESNCSSLLQNIQEQYQNEIQSQEVQKELVDRQESQNFEVEQDIKQASFKFLQQINCFQIPKEQEIKAELQQYLHQEVNEQKELNQIKDQDMFKLNEDMRHYKEQIDKGEQGKMQERAIIFEQKPEEEKRIEQQLSLEKEALQNQVQNYKELIKNLQDQI